MSAIKHKLIDEFNDKEYAHAYMDAHLIDRISTQIYQLRLQRGLTQQQLSEISGIAQERISLLESGDFSSITMKTLRKLAEAFDVAISIKFESFADAIEDFVNLNIDALQVEDRLSSLKRLKDSNQTSTKINMGDNWRIHHFSDQNSIADHMLKNILLRHNISVREASINQSHHNLTTQFENFTINVVEKP